jgi:hypothetical protein
VPRGAVRAKRTRIEKRPRRTFGRRALRIVASGARTTVVVGFGFGVVVVVVPAGSGTTSNA